MDARDLIDREEIEAAWDVYDKAMADVNRDGLKVMPRKRP